MADKKKISKKSIALIIIACVVLSFVLVTSALYMGFRLTFFTVSEHITDQVEIYVPDGVADEFKQYLSIDIDEYWIFHLSKKEQNEMEKDIEAHNWRVMNSTDVMYVEQRAAYDEDSVIYKSINNHKCYIYIFDCDNKIELPNDNGYFIGNDCYQWIIFIYDTETNYYYIFHQSM